MGIFTEKESDVLARTSEALRVGFFERRVEGMDVRVISLEVEHSEGDRLLTIGSRVGIDIDEEGFEGRVRTPMYVDNVLHSLLDEGGVRARYTLMPLNIAQGGADRT